MKPTGWTGIFPGSAMSGSIRITSLPAKCGLRRISGSGWKSARLTLDIPAACQVSFGAPETQRADPYLSAVMAANPKTLTLIASFATGESSSVSVRNTLTRSHRTAGYFGGYGWGAGCAWDLRDILSSTVYASDYEAFGYFIYSASSASMGEPVWIEDIGTIPYDNGLSNQYFVYSLGLLTALPEAATYAEPLAAVLYPNSAQTAGSVYVYQKSAGLEWVLIATFYITAVDTARSPLAQARIPFHNGFPFGPRPRVHYASYTLQDANNSLTGVMTQTIRASAAVYGAGSLASGKIEANQIAKSASGNNVFYFSNFTTDFTPVVTKTENQTHYNGQGEDGQPYDTLYRYWIHEYADLTFGGIYFSDQADVPVEAELTLTLPVEERDENVIDLPYELGEYVVKVKVAAGEAGTSCKLLVNADAVCDYTSGSAVAIGRNSKGTDLDRFDGHVCSG